MSHSDTKQRIVRHLRSSDEPALSARKLADGMDVSVKTINNHADQLVSENRVATTQVGNATAYYITFDDLPTRKKPDHTCFRCGRIVNGRHDFAKIDFSTYFEHTKREDSMSDFHVLCRFCYSDLVSWLHRDEGSMGQYPFVHGWDIENSQMEEVREDPDVETFPGREHLDEDQEFILDYVEEHHDDFHDGISRGILVDEVEEERGVLRPIAKDMVVKLHRGGYLYSPVWHKYRPAK